MRDALAKIGDVTHVFFCAYQYTGSFAEDATVNFDLFRNLIQALERTSKNLKHVFFMSGTKWYGKCPRMCPSICLALLHDHQPCIPQIDVQHM